MDVATSLPLMQESAEVKENRHPEPTADEYPCENEDFEPDSSLGALHQMF